MPTEQELKEKEELSDIQFSAHITEEYSAEITGTAPEIPPGVTSDFTQGAVPGIAPGFPDEAAPQSAPEQPLPEDEFSRHDREILAALDEMLHKNSAPPPVQHRRKHRDLRRFTTGTIKRGAGVLSLAVTLAVMGITLMCLLISGTPDFSLLIKLSPIAAVLLGVEIMLSWFASGRKIRIHIPCVCVNAAVVIGCCILASVLSRNITDTEREFSNRSAEAEIYDKAYPLLKHTADISEMTVSADLNLEGGKARTDGSLTTADDISVRVVLDGNYTSPEEFAAECGSIMRVFSDLDIPTDRFSFIAETRLISFAMDIDGRFQQGFTDEKLTKLVRYVLIEDYDYIQDLADFTEETSEAAAED